MRREKPHPALTRFRLCKEFGWTLKELYEQPAKEVDEFTVILGEIDRQTEREIEKAEGKARRMRR